MHPVIYEAHDLPRLSALFSITLIELAILNFSYLILILQLFHY